MNQSVSFTSQIKAEAKRLGFLACGIAPAQPVDMQENLYYTHWLHNGYQAEMGYLERNLDKRYNPQSLFEETKSIISVALNYYPRQKLKEDQLQFAYYAYGKDYHDIMKQKLDELYSFIITQIPSAKGRIFCDTAPLLERYWAVRAGIGWIGKNTQLIIPGAGSYFFLGEIILNIELDYDSPYTRNRCGNCTRCLDSCPTNALIKPHTLDSNRCLSYLTIEHKGDIPTEQASCLENRIYGCDECQKACPWNRFAKPNNIPELQPTERFLNMKSKEWESFSVEDYRVLFKGSAVKRAKYDGLIRNIKASKNNK